MPTKRKSSRRQIVAPVMGMATLVCAIGLVLQTAEAQGVPTTARNAAPPVNSPYANAKGPPVPNPATAPATTGDAPLAENPAAATAPAVSPALAAPSTATAAPAESAPAWPGVPGNRTVSISLKQLGAWGGPRLTGTASDRYFAFRLRPDEAVVGARLIMGYDYSPALLPELSHLVVAVNGQNVGLFGTPPGQNLNNQREIPIPPSIFTRNNELRFQFVGHYTLECENPYNSTLWMAIHEQTRLELDVVPRNPGINDLRQVADLFAPRGSFEPVRIPMVFATNPGPETVRAAGIVSSWVGAVSASRSVDLQAIRNSLPPTNAILFLRGGESVAGISSTSGSGISLVPNPNNPAARVLVISGADDEGLVRAARALATDSRGLSGTNAVVTGDHLPAARKPYDAPAWIPTNRKVKFGELASKSDLNLENQIAGAVRVNYRVPPDVFTWRTLGAPAEIRYRATQLPTLDNSNLNIALNRQALQSISLADHTVTDRTIKQKTEQGKPAPLPNVRLLKPIDGVSLRTLNFHLPAYATQGRDQLTFGFNFDIRGGGDCQNVPLAAMVGSVDSESWLDYSGFPHYAAMPDLQMFSSMGFPFTRMADLSETAVVLPSNANEAELSLYLKTMQLMGESTGYPVLRHAVTDPAGVANFADKDLLVIGSGNSQPLIAQWADNLPISNVGGQRRLRETVDSWRPQYRWEESDTDLELSPLGSINLARAGSISVAMGFESPLKKGRNAVFLYADRAQDLKKISDAVSDPDRWNQIRGDFSLIGNENIETAKVTPTYYLGSLPVVSKVRWFLRDQPLAVAISGLLAIAALATLGYRRQRKRRS